MFENIDYIYEVYKQKSFSKAAKVLFINQSSLSLTIQKAEKRLGLPIFNRKTKPVTLTDFGKRYIEAIEKIHSLEQEIQKRYRGVQYIISCIDHIENKKEFLTYHKNFVCG